MERDQHQEICNDGGLLCESKEVSVNNHNSDAGKGFSRRELKN
jgi:hypothetical protein